MRSYISLIYSDRGQEKDNVGTVGLRCRYCRQADKRRRSNGGCGLCPVLVAVFPGCYLHQRLHCQGLLRLVRNKQGCRGHAKVHRTHGQIGNRSIHGIRSLEIPFQGCFGTYLGSRWQAVLKSFPSLDVGPIGEFNHWDRRECRVRNPEVWTKRDSACLGAWECLSLRVAPVPTSSKDATSGKVHYYQ